jgi:hypothetical protein
MKPKRKRALTLGRGSFFSFAASRRDQFYFVLFSTDPHRVRGVLSFVALLSPVESSIHFPPELSELTGFFYILVSHPARSFFAFLDAGLSRVGSVDCAVDFPSEAGWHAKAGGSNYLINRLSRSWSRPTNDFMVRNLPNNS